MRVLLCGDYFKTFSAILNEKKKNSSVSVSIRHRRKYTPMYKAYVCMLYQSPFIQLDFKKFKKRNSSFYTKRELDNK